MMPELRAHDWYLVFRDLSLDGARQRLPEMGLRRPEDSAFADELQPLMQSFERQKDSDRDEEQLKNAILQVAGQRLGQEYPLRLRDWSVFIYPTQTRYRGEIFHWQIIVKRGAKNPAKDVQPVPGIIIRVRTALASLSPVQQVPIHPISDWDIRCCREREEQGIGCFEWAEAAVQNYRFLYAWLLSNPSIEEVEEVYRWALSEAALLKMPIKTLGRPEEFLTLPQSLR